MTELNKEQKERKALSEPLKPQAIDDMKMTTRQVQYEKALDLLERYEWVVTAEDAELFTFDLLEGIWQDNGEIIAKRGAEADLGDYATKAVCNEIINHLQNMVPQIKRCEFDSNINFIPVANNVLNLEGNPAPVPMSYDKELYLTHKLPVVYDPCAECPRFKKFLEEILPNEADRQTVIEMIGYCLHRAYPIHRMFMLVGDGANGKTTLLNVIKELLGKPNYASETLQDLAVSRFRKAMLVGKLANICADIPPKPLKQTGMIKMLTGGDTMSVERKWKDPFELDNYAKLIFSANVQPMVTDESFAFWRRWVVIEFPNTFKQGDNADPRLLEKLTTPTELSGILNLALDGLARVLKEGRFSASQSTEQMREQWLKRSDNVYAFLADDCLRGPEYYIPKEPFYMAYGEYCANHMLSPVSPSIFAKRLLLYGIGTSRIRSGSKRIYIFRGCALKETGQLDLKTKNEEPDPAENN